MSEALIMWKTSSAPPPPLQATSKFAYLPTYLGILGDLNTYLP